MRERNIVTTEVIGSRSEMAETLMKEEERKIQSFCFVVVELELIFCHPCIYVRFACEELFGEVVYFTERGPEAVIPVIFGMG